MRRWSPYNYVFNNPLRFTDPDGMKPLDDYFNEKGKYALIAQETHYDPWGLELAGIGKTGLDRFTFNAQSEKQKDLNGGKGYFYETDFRGYDPQLGRFHGYDLMASAFSGITPYQFGFNNPVRFNDPTGLAPCPDGDCPGSSTLPTSGSPGGGKITPQPINPTPIDIPKPDIKPVTYTVQKGDNPYRIAQNHNVLLDDLARSNPQNFRGDISQDNYWKDNSGKNWSIHPGDVLNIPEASYVITPELNPMLNHIRYTKGYLDFGSQVSTGTGLTLLAFTRTADFASGGRITINRLTSRNWKGTNKLINYAISSAEAVNSESKFGYFNKILGRVLVFGGVGLDIILTASQDKQDVTTWLNFAIRNAWNAAGAFITPIGIAGLIDYGLTASGSGVQILPKDTEDLGNILSNNPVRRAMFFLRPTFDNLKK